MLFEKTNWFLQKIYMETFFSHVATVILEMKVVFTAQQLCVA